MTGNNIPYTTINMQDLGPLDPNLQQCMNNLLPPLNLNFEYASSLFDHGISFYQNMLCQVSSVTFTTTSAYVDGMPGNFTQNPVRFNQLFNGIPSNYITTNITTTSTKANPSIDYKSVQAKCSQNSGQITINYVTGLEAATTYTINLLVF